MRTDRAVFAGTVALIAVLVAFNPTPDSGGATAEFMVDGEKRASLTLEVAETREERAKGLMNRTSLEEGHGMLFIYPGESVRTFWMKNTYIPLDIIFVAGNGTVVDIQQADPEPDTPEEELERYTSREPAKYVIETHQSFSEEKDIEAGDRVRIRY